MCRAILLLCFLPWLPACAGSYWTEVSDGTTWVFKIGEDGKKQLVYVERGDRLTIHEPDDPKAHEAQARHNLRHPSRESDAARIARIKKAPKRAANDPIFIALTQFDLGPKLSQGQSIPENVSREIRQHFSNDPILSLSDDPDVDVEVKIYLTDVIHLDNQTQKTRKGAKLNYEATIRNKHLPETFTVKETGGILENVAATKRFCDQIKIAIKNNVGPTIPKDRSKF